MIRQQLAEQEQGGSRREVNKSRRERHGVQWRSISSLLITWIVPPQYLHLISMPVGTIRNIGLCQVGHKMRGCVLLFCLFSCAAMSTIGYLSLLCSVYGRKGAPPILLASIKDSHAPSLGPLPYGTILQSPSTGIRACPSGSWIWECSKRLSCCDSLDHRRCTK